MHDWQNTKKDNKKDASQEDANMYGVNVSIISKAYKRRDAIYAEAGKADAAKLLGQKHHVKKPLKIKKLAVPRREELDQFLLHACRERNRSRRICSIKWVLTMCRNWKQRLHDQGLEVIFRGDEPTTKH